ncbi:MAG: alpha-ketoglutarate-dependent dioxygenase AlkB family protein, partial [Sediminibacterium sp.]
GQRVYQDESGIFEYDFPLKEGKNLLKIELIGANGKKAVVEKISNETYNSCLLNLYHDGEEGMGWHSDAEPELKPNGAIASISFGAERKFNFKHKITQEKKQIILHHGSLLVMKGTTQRYWQHQLPSSKIIKEPRINLTFRTIQE